jgi:hypothetical protein
MSKVGGEDKKGLPVGATKTDAQNSVGAFGVPVL